MKLKFASPETKSGRRMGRFAEVVRRAFEADAAVVELIDPDGEWVVECVGVDPREVPFEGRGSAALLEESGAEEESAQWGLGRGSGCRYVVPADIERMAAWTGVVRRDPEDADRQWAIWLFREDGPGWSERDVLLLRDTLGEWSRCERLGTQVKRLELLTETMHDLVGLHDLDGTYRWVSPAFERKLGYSREELIGRNPYELFHPEDRDRIRRESHRKLLTGRERRLRIEFRMRTKEGDWVWLETLNHGIEDEEGNLVGLQTTSRDITERRRARQQLKEANERLNALIDVSPLAIVTVDREWRVRTWNRAAEQTFGWSEEEVLGRKVDSFLVPSGSRGRFRGRLDRAFQGGASSQEEAVRLTKSGEAIDVHLSVAPIEGPGGEIEEVMGLLEDITALKSQRRALEASENRFRSIFEEAGIGMALVSEDWELMEVNPAMAEMLGYSRAEMAGMTVDALSVDDEGLEEDRRQHARMMEGEQPSYRLEKLFERADGSQMWGRLTVSLVRDEQGEPDYVIGMIEDITEQKRAEKRLVYRASHDGLTGLLNRQSFERELERVVEQARQQEEEAPGYCVMFLDLDEFKIVNDSLGHQAGDELLKTVAERLEGVLREEDVISRLGGDEFAILLRHVETPEKAEEIAGRIQRVVRQPVSLEGHVLHPAGSLGIAMGGEPYREASELLREADAAMYHAKRGERQSYAFFKQPMQDEASEYIQLGEELRQGLQRGELVPYFQPIVRLHDRSWVGLEALVRWEHPERGLLTPGEFLGVADNAGLLAEVDRAVLEQVCARRGRWEELVEEGDLFVSVNCSGKHFVQGAYLERVAEILAGSEVAPSRIVLEVTESLLLEGNERVQATVEMLEALEAQVCIDDFGTGYSSLSALHQLPIDWMKVDRSFVSRIGRPEEEFPLLSSIRVMAENLGLRLVAEGVERMEQAAWLQAHGFRCAQGYLFGRPQPLEVLLEEAPAE